MDVVLYIAGILFLVASVVTIVLVLMQQGHEKNMGVVTGSSSDTYMGKNRVKTKDAVINKWVSILATVIIVLTLVVIFIYKYAI